MSYIIKKKHNYYYLRKYYIVAAQLLIGFGACSLENIFKMLQCRKF